MYPLAIPPATTDAFRAGMPGYRRLFQWPGAFQQPQGTVGKLRRSAVLALAGFAYLAGRPGMFRPVIVHWRQLLEGLFTQSGLQAADQCVPGLVQILGFAQQILAPRRLSAGKAFNRQNKAGDRSPQRLLVQL